MSAGIRATSMASRVGSNVHGRSSVIAAVRTATRGRPVMRYASAPIAATVTTPALAEMTRAARMLGPVTAKTAASR